MNRSLISLGAACCTALLLAGCGQKGPLFLPGDDAGNRAEIPEVPDTDEIDDEQDGSDQ